MKSCIYATRVMHKRMRPVRHRFVYNVFSLLLDLDELDEIDRRLRLLSVQRFNLMSFLFKDHGLRDGSDIRPWVDEQFERAGLPRPARTRLLCFPRLFGYVFNPLSIYYGYDTDERLMGIVYEVKNTFGGQHCYVLPVEAGTTVVRQSCNKEFYVSPFIPMEATYHFKLEAPDERLMVAILETTAEGPLLVATQHGERRPLTDRQILRCLLVNGLMTVKVIAGIHWEALRLFIKRVPLVPRVGT
jgi:DUF1365 family protein